MTRDHIQVFADAAAALEGALKALDEQPGYHPALGHLNLYRSAISDARDKLRLVALSIPVSPVVMEKNNAVA
jgi:hypothetical protein